MASLSLIAGIAAVVLVLRYVFIRLFRPSTVKDLRGPPSPSFWIGNEQDIRYQDQVGDVEFKWMHDYGNAWRIAGNLGEDVLMITDPKAIQYILHTSGYKYPKPEENRGFVRLIVGQGIIWAEGETHRRQRKIMNPAFSPAQLRSFLPLFQHHTQRLIQKWREELVGKGAVFSGATINIAPWLSRATLDIIAAAGFNYDVGALDNASSELHQQYANLFIDSTLYPSMFDTIFKSFWKYIPSDILHFVRFLPSREYTRFRNYTQFMRKFAPEIIRKNESAGSKDIITVLQQANASEDAKTRLSDVEVWDQVATLLVAGHDTTATALTFFLWELAKDPAWQAKIRDEIQTARAHVCARGDEDFSIADLEGLPALQAALKESLRLHPIVWSGQRTATEADVIPLAYPIVTKSGQHISEIPIQKGQKVTISTCAYNRMPEIWGPKAHEWHPQRFLDIDKSKQTGVGVYANLECWQAQLLIIEQQAIAAALLENFDFTIPDKPAVIHRKPTAIMMPLADGLGLWMGLKVKSVQ
ncbi:hypothetical protein EWM64_g1476 [Hericium alpestre]|uniref:Cytochrome P450 n=1 Tax=Hericium alpestre TaxID=135208 RepID=A0A4Z0A8E2_9AGAM|nr:hypothetical protein EWM64_g1476 [Hericium alpestre]